LIYQSSPRRAGLLDGDGLLVEDDHDAAVQAFAHAAPGP
jgi:hypothetical protein